MASAYYNEWESFPAEWLRNLAAAHRVTPGLVDERSIADVQPADLDGFTRAHFFAGIGGWEEALRLAEWPAEAPVWTGSCPCQPFSAAGKRGGADDERHLWPAFHRLIAECRPPVILGEQVASADGRAWLSAVRADLEALGYAVGAADLCAAGVGAPHIRQRLYWVAYDDSAGSLFGQRNGEPQEPEQQASLRHDVERCGAVRGGLAHGDGSRRGPGRPGEAGDGGDAARLELAGLRADCFSPWADLEWLPCSDGKARPTQPGLFPLAHGVPGRVGKLRAAGNAIVPQVAATFVRAFMLASIWPVHRDSHATICAAPYHHATEPKPRRWKGLRA